MNELRFKIITLLKKWLHKELNEIAVHEMAEVYYEDYADFKMYAESHPESIDMEVLRQLELMNYRLITPDDIPAIISFLETLPGEEREAWEKWKTYWDSIDFDVRRKALTDHPFYRK